MCQRQRGDSDDVAEGAVSGVAAPRDLLHHSATPRLFRSPARSSRSAARRTSALRLQTLPWPSVSLLVLVLLLLVRSACVAAPACAAA